MYMQTFYSEKSSRMDTIRDKTPYNHHKRCCHDHLTSPLMRSPFATPLPTPNLRSPITRSPLRSAISLLPDYNFGENLGVPQMSAISSGCVNSNTTIINNSVFTE